jgi:hypothetical protein
LPCRLENYPLERIKSEFGRIYAISANRSAGRFLHFAIRN